MALTGWTLPQTTTGKASLLPPPPWHYSGDIISVDFTADPDTVAGLLPPGMEPLGDGSGSFVFADWASAADGNPAIQADPTAGQYHEAYCILYGTHQGKKWARIPYIWVDSDLSLVRGHIQGFPKKFGEIAMTKVVELGRGGSKKEPGGTFTGVVASRGRRIVSATVTLEAAREGFYPASVARPLLHTRLFPAIEGDRPAVREFQKGRIAGFEVGTVWTGSATLEFGDSPFEEIADLAPLTVGPGYVHTMAFSVVGGATEAIPE